jgi:regulator of sigma E protease
VAPGTPAAAAGFKAGDLIVRIGSDHVESADEAVQDIRLRSGAETTFVVERDGRRIELTATPQRTRSVGGGLQPAQYGRLGVEIGGDARQVRYAPDKAIVEGARQSWRLLDLTVTYLGRVVTGKESGDAIGGPLGTAAVSGAVVKQAVAAAPGRPALQLLFAGAELLQLAAILSVSVGFLNLLPIPILDGGHLLFYAYEAVARKPLGARVQEAGFRIGLALLAGLMLFATWNDLQKLSVFKNLGGLLS